MGRLAGFRYREIVRRLKQSGLEFHWQAAGSHEIWLNPISGRYTTIPNHPGDMPEGTLRAILKKRASRSKPFWLRAEPDIRLLTTDPSPPSQCIGGSHFLLSGRNILADQMDYLTAMLPAHSRLNG